MGGSFNPLHIGHLIMAQDAMERFELDRVVFIPCANPPHKPELVLISAVHRVAMLHLAVEDNPCFEVSDIEIRRGGISYTLDTMDALQVEYPGEKLYFIIGGDSLQDLHGWRNSVELVDRYDFISLVRPGVKVPETPEDLKVPAHSARRLLDHIVSVHQIDVSSSEIRRRVAEGQSIRYLVPTCVEMYIHEHGLYR